MLFDTFAQSQMLAIKNLPPFKTNRRTFSTSFVLFRKTLEPYDKRWGLHVTQAGPQNKGGSKELEEKLLRARKLK